MNLDEIKNKIDIIDVVQKYVKLKRVGKYYVGLCPFHKETKPSFYVSPEMQIFKCFGCNLGGDVLRFLMKIENLTLPQILEKLKEEYGLDIKTFQDSKEINKEKKQILEINYAALKFFRQELKKNKSAIDYLLSRGLKEKTIDGFEIGFSPGNTLLRDYLYSLGYSFELIKKAGLLDSQNFDRFQSRIIFPLRDENNKLVGFSGRIFPSNLPGPKYLNTPETLIFHKSKFLYGLVYAKDYILNSKKVILVEGQMDFLLAWQNGFKNLVAISGSALTEDHLIKLKRFTNNLVFAFDNDQAGFNAELRANLMAKNIGFQTYKLIYPGKDLGEYFLLETQEELKEEKYEDYLLNFLFQKYGLGNKQEIISLFLPQIKKLPPLEKDEYLDKLSSLIGISKNILEEELKNKDFAVPSVTNKKIDIFEEKTLLEKFSFRLVSIVYFLYKENLKNYEFFEGVQTYLSGKFKEIFWKIVNNKLDEKEIDYFEMAKNFYLIDSVSLEKDYHKTLKNLKIIFLKQNLKNLSEKLKFAEKEESDKIIKEINNIVKELKILNKNA